MERDLCSVQSFNQSQISLLFERLQSKRLSWLFDLVHARHSDFSPSISVIRANVDSARYASVFDFALDVRCMILRARRLAESDGNRCIVAGLTDLSAWFDRKVAKAPRNADEARLQQLRRLQKRVEAVKRGMCMSAYDRRIAAIPPGFDVRAAQRPPPALVDEIQCLLRDEAASADVQMMVISLLRRHIPGFEPAPQTTLDADKMSLRCAEELRDLLLAARARRTQQTD